MVTQFKKHINHFRIILSSILKWVFVLLIVTIPIGLNNCKSLNHKNVEDEYTLVQKRMDDALLSNQPLIMFEKILPEINNYNCVDSAWITGNSVWVKYKNGGKQSWIITPEN